MSSNNKVSNAEKFILTAATETVINKLSTYDKDLESFAVFTQGKSNPVTVMANKVLTETGEATKDLIQAMQELLEFCSLDIPSRQAYERHMLLIEDGGELMLSLKKNHDELIQLNGIMGICDNMRKAMSRRFNAE
jgi:hypothetical protein